MTQDLSYDMMLEVQGLIRSLAVRTKLDRELQVGDSFTLHDRDWIVHAVRATERKGLDRRVIAREVSEAA
jgi:hypothetical protein